MDARGGALKNGSAYAGTEEEAVRSKRKGRNPGHALLRFSTHPAITASPPASAAVAPQPRMCTGWGLTAINSSPEKETSLLRARVFGAKEKRHKRSANSSVSLPAPPRPARSGATASRSEEQARDKQCIFNARSEVACLNNRIMLAKALVQVLALVPRAVKRKRQLHTPRVNGKIPDVNNATIDHESLLERFFGDRLGTYGLAEYQIEGDGNCQFRALADQIFRNPDYHKHVRKAVVKQLKEFKKHYEGYVPMEYKVYLKKMKRSGEWGDHVTLQAAADRVT
ncbi:hypothetical protein EJB05_24497, partial [Eragrostis curvula]